MAALLIIGLIYIGISYCLNNENADSLLAGYNTLSNERKKLYDIDKIVFYINKTARYTGFSILIVGILTYWLKNVTLALIFLIYVPIVPIMVVNIYTRLSFSKDPLRWYDWLLYTIIGFTLLIFPFVISWNEITLEMIN
ncbi:DUF3784 domain-containing protein [Myroides injenensis]|uniref:DUF3784 domain-containing protein n=1 Tax=Myroides injenensis TaxID=1183151 RepID=UPI00226E15B2|nr:DUF3784 domain-containing protein [Myroides injenensis]